MGIAVLSLLPTFLVGQRGVSLGTAGLATGIVEFASVPGSVVASWLLRRGAGPRLLSATILVMPLAALAAFGAGGAVSVRVAAAAVMLLANGLAVAGVFAAVPRLVHDPSQIAIAIGLLTQLGSVGTLLGAAVRQRRRRRRLVGGRPLVGATTLLSLGLLLAASSRRRLSHA